MRRAAVVALVMAALESAAHGFVRHLDVKTGAPVFWRQSCVPVTIYLNGFDDPKNMHGDVVKFELSTEATVKSIAAAAHAWSIDSVRCGDGAGPSLEIVPALASPGASPPETAYDARNSVVFRTDYWGMSGRSGLKFDYDPAGLAVTTVWSEGDGHIVDVDVEINATNPLKIWMNFDPGVAPPPQRGDIAEFVDLQNALTHEFGHLIGLDHTCFKPKADKVRGRNDQNLPVPDCDEAPADARAAVMFPDSPDPPASKRTLSRDDILAVCTIYPSSRTTATCALDTPPPGCAIAPAPLAEAPAGPSKVAVAVAVVAGAVLARRRRVTGRGRARA